MNNKNGNSNFRVRAVFLTGVTDFGNELLAFHPKIEISEYIDHDLCLKTMPMACQDGDMLITHIGNLLAVSVSRLVPSFENDTYKSETFATLGILLPLDTNPIPFYKIVSKLLERLNAEGRLNKETLVDSVPNLYRSLNFKF